MSILAIILILLLLGAFGGGFAGAWPHQYGISVGGVLLIVLIILLVSGRL
jgi:hypothetical protein